MFELESFKNARNNALAEIEDARESLRCRQGILNVLEKEAMDALELSGWKQVIVKVESRDDYNPEDIINVYFFNPKLDFSQVEKLEEFQKGKFSYVVTDELDKFIDGLTENVDYLLF
jgi:hypothetical protein